MAATRIYRVMFLNDSKIYEIYAKHVSSDLEMYGFVEIGDIIFNSTSGIVVDPVEEKLKTEFAGVKRTFIPMSSVFRIDEVDKEGVAKISEAGSTSNIHQFPASSYTPDNNTRR